jgi:hypothetical protein
MDADEVKAALDAKRDSGSVVRRLGSLKQMTSTIAGRGLPPSIRAFVNDAFAASAYTRSTMVSQKRGEIEEQFSGYTTADWRRAIVTLLPQFAESAEAACDALVRRPFQEGLTRKPFRSPPSSETLAAVRGRWLLNTTLLVGEYDADILWIAEHAVHLASWWGQADIGWLLAGALDSGDAKVFETLAAIARGDAGSAQMGRHVIQALMSCGRPEAWELVERLLLSAQRQEGLRQVVLESVDEAHPQAFRRMLRLILDHDLVRFSSVVRAADTWFGFAWDGASAVKTESLIERVLRYLDDPAARTAALEETDAETVYLALWSIAFDDVDAAIRPAVELLRAPTTEIRFVATHFLVQSLWSSALSPLVDALSDSDLRVAARALDMFSADLTASVDGERLFTALEKLLTRLSKRAQTLEGIVWPWWTRKLERSTVASALAANAKAVAPERLLPYVPDLDPHARAVFIRRAAGIATRWQARTEEETVRRVLSAAERAVALDLLGDASADVRAAAFEAMRETPLLADETERLVDLLGRKPGDLRNGALARLRSLKDAELLATGDRLLADVSDLRRLAGLELLRDACEARRLLSEVRARVRGYASERTSLSEPERAHVDAVLGSVTKPASRDDALGLLDGVVLREWPAPRARRIEIESPAAAASLTALAALVLANSATEIRTASGETRLLVESIDWRFGPQRREDLNVADAAVPLASTWRAWLTARPDAIRDRDDLELLRALIATDDSELWKTDVVRQVCGLGQWSAGSRFLRGLCEWCVVWEPPATGFDFLLNGFENALAEISNADYRELSANRKPKQVFHGPSDKAPESERKAKRADQWLQRLRWWRELFPASVLPGQAERLYGLLRAFEVRSEGFGMLRVNLDDFLGVYRPGVVNETELTDLLVGRWSYQPHSTLLRELTARRPPRGLLEHPELLAVVDRCRRRVVEVETQRGDRETAASGLVMELRWTGGADTLARAVPALGKSHFTRNFTWPDPGASRQETLSHLVLRSVPRPEDRPEAFAQWASEAKISEARLVELAVYAPQWAAHVNCVLEWPELEGSVWWIQAHTKDDRPWGLQELKEIWAAEVSERTPLSALDLTEGAVDVAWFTRVHQQLGATHWKALDTAAKYAASSAGHTRAQLFARAMSGMITREEVLERIDTSRHQDSVRALGLLPLADGADGRRDLLERYQRLAAFKREARKFGSQRQQSESRAVAIGLANLARTAGYRDPQRLQWAMEQESVADLARGPVIVDRGDVRVTLSVDVDGEPSLTFAKQGKPLKSLPAALKKDPDVEGLKARLQELRRQRSRVRDALEEAMTRGDFFQRDELGMLLEHPILAPALGRLVFIGDGVAGYLAEGGRVLRDHAGMQHVIGNDEEIRIAHPHDLLVRGDWSSWQTECFRAERIQPFKQVFREVYPMTAAERGTEQTRRYAGHQVNPRQALALLGGRGWVVRPEEGVSRTFHEDGVTARLGFQESFFTPADIEGLTLEDVVFTRKGEWSVMPLDSVPPRLFSETMRDLDLVVSVAHQGGVDPEATASTVEMRATLLRETCELLGLGNVEVDGSHVRIRGSLGEYAVHLGSASVIVLPGTAIPIVAVHSQHRGRLFLPFADADPKTAEVLSKVLLLARDSEIRDPNILEWIRAARGTVMT